MTRLGVRTALLAALAASFGVPAQSAGRDAGAVPQAAAKDGGAANKTTGKDGGPAAKAAGSASALPPGHPDIDPGEVGDEQDDLPAGHPKTGGQAAAENRLPEDLSNVDKDLPAGTIVVEIRDAAARPVPRAEMTLGILQNTVAKGESRRHVVKTADDEGNLRFDGLEFGGGVAYRVTVPQASSGGGEGATYAAPPFQLDLHHGQRVRVHLFPATNRIEDVMLGMDGIVYMELKDDAIQFDELFRVYNLGAVTWVPQDVVITLPTGFKAFVTQREMSDVGFDEAPGRGAKLRGTFGPGQHEIKFRFQIPYDGNESIAASMTLPPHVARMRIMAEASKGMTLHVTDFPTSITERNNAGQRILLTERQLRAGETPMARLGFTLENIPTEGIAKWVATLIAGATILLGLYIAFDREKSKTNTTLPLADHDVERARARLVVEIAELDKARAAGEVGPKAHDRIRAALLDALARLMGAHEPTSST